VTGVPLTGLWLGRRPYAATYALQLELMELRKQRRIGDLVLCLEHEPVITLGRGARPEHLLASEAEFAERGIAVERSDRGGEITLHAPGQLVAYPIVALPAGRQDVRRYVQDLSATMRDLLAPFGVQAGQITDLIGVWVDSAQAGVWPGEAQARAPQKIGAIGVRLSRWVSMHGFALNLKPDLSLYRLIVPCGVTAYGVCSLASLGRPAPEPSALAPRAHRALAERLGLWPAEFLDVSEAPLAELGAWLSSPGLVAAESVDC
jgi:lipoyl(octanoyl) transferase